MDAEIDRLQRASAERPGTLLLGGGLPADELFPRRALHDAFNRAVTSPTALQYGWPEGARRLREWIAARLRRRGAALEAEDVIVTAGAQQALAIAAEALLDLDERVAVDAETYPAALDLFRTRGARPSTEREHVGLVYAMPAVANPRGDVASEASRAALLACGSPLVEDDAYAELRFDGRTARPLVADAREHVWHVGTLSKCLCPGLRVGWLVPPPPFRRRAMELKQAQDLQAGSLAQAVVEELFAEFDLDAHLTRARRLYAARADALVEALRRTFPGWSFREPEGGFSIFVETGEAVDDARFLAVAVAHGVSFDPGRLFRPDARSDRLAFRLCYSATPPEGLRDAVARLEAAWNTLS